MQFCSITISIELRERSLMDHLKAKYKLKNMQETVTFEAGPSIKVVDDRIVAPAVRSRSRIYQSRKHRKKINKVQ